jgi:hypothetical protein
MKQLPLLQIRLGRTTHVLGNFELDFDNGEICYKTSIDITDDRFNFALIQQLVYTNITIMDQYLPGIQAVLSGKVSPVEAIRAIELRLAQLREFINLASFHIPHTSLTTLISTWKVK